MGLSLQSQTPTHRYTHMQILHALRVPLIMLLPRVPPLFIKNSDKKRGCRREQGGKERLLRQSPPACLVRSVGACGGVCLWRRLGRCMGIDFGFKRPDWETPTHPPTPPRREDGSGGRATRDSRRCHGSNLLSGRHKGEVRGQISAARWMCFLMVMSSQTSLHHSRAVSEENATHRTEACEA